MYVNPYLAGIVTAVFVELLLVFGVAIYKAWRNRRGN